MRISDWSSDVCSSDLTAVAVVGPNGRQFTALDTTTVRFRTLGQDEIARYVDAEQPFDCAGSFKAEGLGIALFEAIESRDPTAPIGLPLIATADLLREAGFALPRSEEHTSELQSLMRKSYAVF